jgi:hypothetical protein
LVDHYPEERVAEPQRGSRDAYTLQRDAHNQLYELVRWLPLGQASLVAVRALVVGSKELPGFAVGVWLIAHGTRPARAVEEVRSATGGRWRAIRSRPRRDRWIESPATQP